MPLAIDLHKAFVDLDRVAVALVFSFQALGVFGSELYAPETDRFVAGGDAKFSEEGLISWLAACPVVDRGTVASGAAEAA